MLRGEFFVADAEVDEVFRGIEGDIADGTDHAPLLKAWIETARPKLTDPATGLLVSSYTLAGKTKDGPEGSSIWMVAHALRAVDPAFAEDQYRRAKQHLARNILGAPGGPNPAAMVEVMTRYGLVLAKPPAG